MVLFQSPNPNIKTTQQLQILWSNSKSIYSFSFSLDKKKPCNFLPLTDSVVGFNPIKPSKNPNTNFNEGVYFKCKI